MATSGNGASQQEEKINTDIVTLTRFLTEEQTKHKEATGDFTYDYCHVHKSRRSSLTAI
jgi:fructose-1,6-bisphosphatase I